MFYCFDESGNWSNGRSNQKLVICGLVIPDQTVLNAITMDFRMLAAKHNLPYLHANEMSPSAKEECYSIIAAYLGKEVKAYSRVFPASILTRSSRMSFEEVYIELSADLVSVLILGDMKPKVFYDMKFHYAYPENTLRETDQAKPYHYDRIMNSLTLKDEAREPLKERILKKVQSIKNPARNTRIGAFLAYLESDPDNAIMDYMWAELYLQIQGKDQARELFRSAIQNNLRDLRIFDCTQTDIPDISISFVGKENNHSGVEMVDFISNLVFVSKNPGNTLISAAGKTILSRMVIEEVRK